MHSAKGSMPEAAKAQHEWQQQRQQQKRQPGGRTRSLGCIDLRLLALPVNLLRHLQGAMGVQSKTSPLSSGINNGWLIT